MRVTILEHDKKVQFFSEQNKIKILSLILLLLSPTSSRLSNLIHCPLKLLRLYHPCARPSIVENLEHFCQLQRERRVSRVRGETRLESKSGWRE